MTALLCALLQHTCSLNVCYFHGAYETDKAVHLVLELLSGGQLWDRCASGSCAMQMLLA